MTHQEIVDQRLKLRAIAEAKSLRDTLYAVHGVKTWDMDGTHADLIAALEGYIERG